MAELNPKAGGPHRSAEELRATSKIHTIRAQEIKEQIERLQGRPLTHSQSSCIESYVLCCLLVRSKKVLAELSAASSNDVANKSLLMMAAHVGDSRLDAIRTIEGAFFGWGVSLDPDNFNSLLEWTVAMTGRLPSES